MPTSQPPTGETRIRVIIGDTVLTGRLWDNATARDLIAQLPLTLTFSDAMRTRRNSRPAPEAIVQTACRQATIRVPLATSVTTPRRRNLSSSTTSMSATSTAS